MKNIVYRISSRLFLTRRITSKLETRISILYPSTREAVIGRVNRQLIRIYLISLLSFLLFLFFADKAFYYFIIILVTVYAIVSSSVNKSMEKLEVNILKQLIEFIETVKFRFQFDGMLEEALLYAVSDTKNYEMSVHGQLIYSYLKESYSSDRGDYQEISPNHFFLTFYSLCESVIKYGDKKNKEGSLFVKNLGYLKEEINIQLLKREAVENTFMGLTGICIIPIYCIKPIEKWSASNIPELAADFDTASWRMITIILVLTSLGIYSIIMRLKYPARMAEREMWVEKLSSLSMVNHMITFYMNHTVSRSVKMERLLKSIAYPYNIAEFYTRRFATSLLSAIITSGVVLSMGYVWMTPFFALAAFCVSYFGCILMLNFKKQLILLEREDEIVRFQGIILMLMHADKITVEQILQQMERFAVSFKSQIEEISDKLSYKGVAIFKEYRDKSDFLPFNRLIDGFIACDNMYIYKAFEDIECDRKYYIEKHKQENMHYIEQRGAIAKFLSFIPLCSVILAKLVIPFVMEGMEQMTAGYAILV